MDLTAAPCVAYVARRAECSVEESRGFEETRAPLLGAFVLAAQIINFPVGPGTTAHLVGGALLLFTLGPAAAAVVMTGPRTGNCGRAPAALNAVGIRVADGAPYHLSAGEKKRAANAGVLAMEPRIVVLDEPITFLDPPAQRSLSAALARLPQSKLLVTHNVPLAAAIATRAGFFEEGRIIAEGPVVEIARFGWEFAFEEKKDAVEG
jgi:hypothetical protein